MKLNYFFSFIFLMGIIPNCLFAQAPDVGHRCVNCGDDSNNNSAQNYNYQAPANQTNQQQVIDQQNQQKQQQFEQDKSEAVNELKGTSTDDGIKNGDDSGQLDESVKDEEPVPSPKVAPPVAHIVSSGEFYVTTIDGRKLTGSEDTIPLDGGSRVITGPTGHLEIALPDHTVFTIGPNSDVVLDDFVYNSPTSAKKIIWQMTKGVFRWVTGKIKDKPSDMKVRLPFANVAIRGTEFEISIQPDKTGVIKLFKGKLEITQRKAKGKFKLTGGQMISFTSDGTFNSPMPLNQ
jgi:hypothetical protein